jgi:hypothetical protein
VRRCSPLFAVLLLVALPCLAAEPVVSFEEQAVVVSGLTPNGQVVWFSVAKQIESSMAHFVRREDVLADEDGDGAVRFELDRMVPLQSIWVAVDLTTGAVAVATPEGYTLRDASLPPGRGSGKAGRPDWIGDDRQLLEILVVRPGLGAWGSTLGDGGVNDEDGRGNGRISAALARLHAVGSSPAPPDHFLPKDLVFAVDLDRMEFLARNRFHQKEKNSLKRFASRFGQNRFHLREKNSLNRYVIGRSVRRPPRPSSPFP